MASAASKFNFDQDFNAESAISTHDFPITEPLIVTVLHVDGLLVSASAGTLHFAGWQTIQPLSEGTPGERRIVVRFAMGEYDARAAKCAMGGALREGY